jgi:hypothetical protein
MMSSLLRCEPFVSVELCCAALPSHHFWLMGANVIFFIYIYMLVLYVYACACSIEAGEVSSSWDENQWKEFLDNLLQS